MSDYNAYNADIDIINSEITVNKNNNTICYNAICVCNGNQMMLTDLVDSTDLPEDWGYDVLNHIHKEALEYLAGVLCSEENIFVDICKCKNYPTIYNIFYDCEDKFADSHEAARWIMTHGGVETNEYYYTETRDGVKTAIEF